MNEERLRAALEEYAEPLRYHPPVSARRRWPVRLAIVGVTGMLASFAVFGLFAPRASAASVMQRMQAAITDAQTMRAELAILDPKTGKESTPYVRRWYDRGIWRIHGRIGRFRERIVLLRDDQMYCYLPTKNVVTAEQAPPSDDWDFKGGSAVDFAMSEVNYGQMNLPRQSRLETGPDGTDRLILERQEDSYRCVIDIDHKTGLPIRARLSYGNANERQTTVHRFFFNEKLDPKLFDPRAFKAPLIDLPTTQAKYRRLWSPPLAEAGDFQARDAAVTGDGTVFVTYSTVKGSPMPDTVRDAHGREYLRLSDMHAGGVRADTNAARTAQYPGRTLLTTVWIPTEPLAKPPKEIEIGISRRGEDSNAIGAGAPHLVRKVRVPLRRIAGDFPEYGTAFVLESYEDSLASQSARRRADFYRRKGDVAAELRWLRIEVAEDFKRVPGWGRERAHELARRLRESGREAEAVGVEMEHGLLAATAQP